MSSPIPSFALKGHAWMRNSEIYNPKNEESIGVFSKTVGKYCLRPMARLITTIFISVIGGLTGFLYHGGAALAHGAAMTAKQAVGMDAKNHKNAAKEHLVASLIDLASVHPILAVSHGIIFAVQPNVDPDRWAAPDKNTWGLEF